MFGTMAPIPDVEYEDLEEMPVFNQTPPRLDSLCATTKFNRREIKLLYQAFKTECPTGRMSVKEFNKIYTYFFPISQSKEFASRVFSAFDKNKDGIVNFEELVNILSDLWFGPLETKIDWAFDLMDYDSKGTIDFEEFLSYLRSIFDLIGYWPSSDRTRFRQNSDLRDRALEIFVVCASFKDFVIIKCSNTLQDLDADGDGLISRHDFMQTCSNSELVVSSLNCLRETVRSGSLHQASNDSLNIPDPSKN